MQAWGLEFLPQNPCMSRWACGLPVIPVFRRHRQGVNWLARLACILALGSSERPCLNDSDKEQLKRTSDINLGSSYTHVHVHMHLHTCIHIHHNTLKCYNTKLMDISITMYQPRANNVMIYSL